jgi:hypothetical protein
MLCCQMRVKALETPPADQAFNRVTAEIARNVAARLKSRGRLRSHQRQGIILASKRATISSYVAAHRPGTGIGLELASNLPSKDTPVGEAHSRLQRPAGWHDRPPPPPNRSCLRAWDTGSRSWPRAERGDRLFHDLVGDLLLRNPITGTADCCARPASGHATVAPPARAMKSRRYRIKFSLASQEFFLRDRLKM